MLVYSIIQYNGPIWPRRPPFELQRSKSGSWTRLDRISSSFNVSLLPSRRPCKSKWLQPLAKTPAATAAATSGLAVRYSASLKFSSLAEPFDNRQPHSFPDNSSASMLSYGSLATRASVAWFITTRPYGRGTAVQSVIFGTLGGERLGQRCKYGTSASVPRI